MDIVAILNSLSSTLGGVRAALDLRDFSKSAGELAKLQEALLTAQQTAFKLNNEILHLRQELTKSEHVLSQKARYELIVFPSGFCTYSLKDAKILADAGDTAFNEPHHFICQKCMDKDNQRVILQPDRAPVDGLIHYWFCPECSARYTIRL